MQGVLAQEAAKEPLKAIEAPAASNAVMKLRLLATIKASSTGKLAAGILALTGAAEVSFVVDAMEITIRRKDNVCQRP